jgi:predicted RNA-binding Zn-ribbon protein involved in translation (DUF1610 family)
LPKARVSRWPRRCRGGNESTKVTDPERFFRQIVLNLAATDPRRLQQPFPLAELRESIVPYRGNRRALRLESSEDYELAVMRLCAGEGGFARINPDEVRAQFVREVTGINPDLTVVERHGEAVVNLDPVAVARVLNQKTDSAYAPQEHVSQPEPTPPPVAASPKPPAPRPRPTSPKPSEAEDRILRCSRCGSGLPVGRPVNFCPQCGQNLTLTRCPECQTELEPSWRHCVRCGLAVKDR